MIHVEIERITLDRDRSGRSGWKVIIHGDVIEAGRTTPAYGSVMSLFVDAETGVVTVFAEG